MKRGGEKHKLKSRCLERCGIGTEEKRLRVIEEGEDWRRFKEFEAELATLKAELTVVELEISNLFAPINKELKLLKKQDETGKFTLTPEERRAISAIISTPIQALGEDFNKYLRYIRVGAHRRSGFYTEGSKAREGTEMDRPSVKCGAIRAKIQT